MPHIETTDFLEGLRRSVAVGRMALLQAARDGMDADAVSSLDLYFAAIEDAVADKAKEGRRYLA